MSRKEEFLKRLESINPSYDFELIGRAYDKADSLHNGQLRKSGEPYIIHPVAVTVILAELGMDEDTLVAGLLHDAVEDTPYTLEDLTKDFNGDIAYLVDGVTKLGSLVYETKEERQAETLRKMFLAMSKDIRVLIIKLSDRLHNLRTINYMSEAKIKDKCNETLEIYAPLASRLGIYTMKFELEDISLKFLHKEAYDDLVKAINTKKEQREIAVNEVIERIEESLKGLNIKYDITGRSKHFYSIYKKMKYQNKQIDEIFDLTAIRIIVNSVNDCYAVLGVVHTMWKPIPGRFKDYIAMPKANMYQSLHTTVIADSGRPFEIQVRTYEMHQIAEYGIAAHWKYKEGATETPQMAEDRKLAWLRQTLEWQQEMKDPKEFMESLKMDLFSHQVYVFTPKGDVMELPAGSTPLDFAFKIHSDVGFKCTGAKVNGKMVSIDYPLENGNIVEVVTTSNSKGPSVDWLKIVKSNHAKSKIKSFLKKEHREAGLDKGKENLDKYLKKKGYEPNNLIKNSYITKIQKQLKLHNLDELYIQLSYGGAFVSKIGGELIKLYNEEHHLEEDKKKNKVDNIEVQHSTKKTKNSLSGVSVEGVDNLLIRLSKCCNPVPGDDIVGFITKGRGISVHRKDCINVSSLTQDDLDRCIDVHWDDDRKQQYFNADVCIIADDRKGMFAALSRVCEDMDIDITGVNAKTSKTEGVNILMTLSISNITHMEKVLRKLKSVEGVREVYRPTT